ncbi:MAG: hypothetical protein U0Z53_02465 [Blastocatellia bacterium]
MQNLKTSVEGGTLSITARQLTRCLLIVVAGLTLAGIAGEWAKYSLGSEYLHAHHLFGLVEKFDLDGENNIPNWYQSSSLLFCAALLATICVLKRMSRARYVAHWGGLALIFLALSLDESASLHEMLVEPVRSVLHTDGFLRYAWVIPGLLFAAGVGLAYLKFLAHLPFVTRLQFILAGAFFISGAVGMEMIGGRLRDLYGLQSVQYVAETIAEEVLEMTGILIFIYGLTAYLGALVQGVQVTVRGEHQAVPGAEKIPAQVAGRRQPLKTMA